MPPSMPPSMPPCEAPLAAAGANRPTAEEAEEVCREEEQISTIDPYIVFKFFAAISVATASSLLGVCGAVSAPLTGPMLPVLLLLLLLAVAVVTPFLLPSTGGCASKGSGLKKQCAPKRGDVVCVMTMPKSDST